MSNGFSIVRVLGVIICGFLLVTMLAGASCSGSGDNDNDDPSLFPSDKTVVHDGLEAEKTYAVVDENGSVISYTTTDADGNAVVNVPASAGDVSFQPAD